MTPTERIYLPAPCHFVLVKKQWGGTTQFNVEDVKKRIVYLLRQYMDSGDPFEACKHIKELRVTFLHYNIRKMTLMFSIETHSARPLILLKLLKETSEGFINSRKKVKGYSRLKEVRNNISHNISSSKVLFQSWIAKAIWKGQIEALVTEHSGEDRNIQIEDDLVRDYKEEVEIIFGEYFLFINYLNSLQVLKNWLHLGIVPYS